MNNAIAICDDYSVCSFVKQARNLTRGTVEKRIANSDGQTDGLTNGRKAGLIFKRMCFTIANGNDQIFVYINSHDSIECTSLMKDIVVSILRFYFMLIMIFSCFIKKKYIFLYL